MNQFIKEVLIHTIISNGMEGIEFDKSNEYVPKIGFKIKNNHVYYWFSIGGTEHRPIIYFDHSYSMNSGKTKRGYKYMPNKVFNLMTLINDKFYYNR